MTQTDPSFGRVFRASSPYVTMHHGHTFVVLLTDGALRDPNFNNVAADLALLSRLDIRVVLLFEGESPATVDLPTVDEAMLGQIKARIGALRIDIEAAFTAVPVETGQHARANLVSGNWVIAQPVGTVDGVDHRFLGRVRRIAADDIQKLIDAGDIALLGPLGYSPTGQLFSVPAGELALAVAEALQASKLIVMTDTAGLLHDERVVSEVSPADLQTQIDDGSVPPGRSILVAAARAGIERCHWISYRDDGALLNELFTRDGAGTQIAPERSDQLRRAKIDDVGRILQLIRPLEEQGVLVRRSRDLLEREIGRFHVVERDHGIIACAALYPFSSGNAEIACVVTDPDYRRRGLAQRLMMHLEQQADRMDLTRLFVLTTQSTHWFEERGFSLADKDALPTERQALYNLQRNSKILIKDL